MHTADKTLKEVLDALIERQVIPQSRLGPIKTALKQYALILGYSEPAECPMTAYHLPDETRNRLIEERAVKAGQANGFTCHSLRHTFVTDMMETTGNDVALVMSYSGHKSIESFKIYPSRPYTC